MSCWAHDKSWMVCTLRAKIESDFGLFLDVWAVSSLANKWWQNVLIKMNAVAMFAAVASIGWWIWAKKWINCKIDNLAPEL